MAFLCAGHGINLTGSAELGVSFIEDNKSKIDIVINDFIAFSNKMEGKDTLSEAEKLIEAKIKDSDVIKKMSCYKCLY